ncbi:MULTISPECIES: HD domain-containing phosphohydrolase [unclassified Clostridium]|uniref:HD domain-containing phosphohydrolase n=1 Tax=unclassified Clostridium TaxID=2614128 RepID=UPI000298416F|nr:MULTISPECIES: HD domain-containing phosphohydrolase [unclassified Clostridium]EKQ53412.1 MAG: response regulator (CheY-like receiver and HD-GYP domain containing protein) [Clostridium sp. Maddingley MBC34-26]
MEHILIVDDNVTNLKFAEQSLKPHYKVTLLTSAVQTMKFLLKNTPDLILLDIKMPGINGYEILNTIKSIDRLSKIPVIFLTAVNDTESELKCLKLGAVDFIGKPFIPELMLSRIKIHLELASYRKNLETLVREKTETIENLQDSMVIGLAELVECRDGETGGHIKRTAKYLEILVYAMSEADLYSDILTDEYIRNIIRSAPLHDIGKIGISDSILLKQGNYDEAERDYMKQHTTLGGMALQKLIDATDDESFLYVAKDMALCHHEKWDGTGYPSGLSKYSIPLCARIMAIADVYDALTSERPYKKPFTHEKAAEIIIDSAGTHFEPCIVDVFRSISSTFSKISQLYNQKLEAME